jgi:hypothetical protein
MTFLMTLWSIMCRKTLLFVLTLVLTLTGHQPEAHAATLNAASCSPTDVQKAINTAVAGDTVHLPTCTYTTWGTTVTITKRLILEGNGTTQTVLKRSPTGALTMLYVSGVTGFELRNLSLDGTYDTHPNVYKDIGLDMRNSCIDFRIHHVAFSNLSQGIQIIGDPTVQRGVIHNNTFTDNYYWTTTAAWGYGIQVVGNGTWPALSLGTAQNIFIETNTFTRNRHTVASNNGSRYVFRYNTIIDNRENAAAIDAHGKAAWPRGSRQYEIYNNSIKNSVTRFAGVGPRGGDGVIFNNVMSPMSSNRDIYLMNDSGCREPIP